MLLDSDRFVLLWSLHLIYAHAHVVATECSHHTSLDRNDAHRPKIELARNVDYDSVKQAPASKTSLHPPCNHRYSGRSLHQLTTSPRAQPLATSFRMQTRSLPLQELRCPYPSEDHEMREGPSQYQQAHRPLLQKSPQHEQCEVSQALSVYSIPICESPCVEVRITNKRLKTVFASKTRHVTS